MSNDAGTSYSMLVSFNGLYETMPEEHAFVHGVEFGGLWARMAAGTEAEIEQTTHEENRTVIARAAAAKGWDVEITPSGMPGWDFTTLRKVRTEKSNPHGLRVVK